MSNNLQETKSEKQRTAFDLLNIPVSMGLDMAVLDRAYHHAQLLYHPDRWVGKTDFERRKVADMAIQINQAYAALRDPRSRAEEILKAHHIPVPKETDQKGQSSALLMELMEWQERLEDASEKDQREQLKRELENILAEKQQAFKKAVSLETYYGLIYFLKLIERLS